MPKQSTKGKDMINVGILINLYSHKWKAGAPLIHNVPDSNKRFQHIARFFVKCYRSGLKIAELQCFDIYRRFQIEI